MSSAALNKGRQKKINKNLFVLSSDVVESSPGEGEQAVRATSNAERAWYRLDTIESGKQTNFLRPSKAIVKIVGAPGETKCIKHFWLIIGDRDL